MAQGLAPGWQRAEPVYPEPKLFVGHLPFESSDEQVREIFSKYGALVACDVLTGPDGRSRGCAMLKYSRWAEAEAAVEAMNGSTQLMIPGGGNGLVVKFADPPKRGDVLGIAPKKLFIGQLPDGTTQAQLQSLFGQYGTTVDVHLLHKGGSAPDCAFVTYSRWAEAEAAMQSLNGTLALPGCKAPISIKFAIAKPDAAKRGLEMMGGMGSMMAAGVPLGYAAVPPPLPNSKRAAAAVAAAAYGAAGGYGGYGGYGMFQGGPPHHPHGQQQGMPPGAAGGGGGRYGAAASTSGGGQPGGPYPFGQPAGPPAAWQAYGPMGGFGMVAHPGPYGGGGGGGPGGSKAGPMGGGDSGKPWKLFIGQIPFEASEADLWPLFGQVGPILELAVLRLPDGRSRGCGFVTYADPSHAEAAAQQFDRKLVLPNDAKGRVLVVKYAGKPDVGQPS